MGHHAAGAHGDVSADGDSGQNDHVMTQPGAVADADGVLGLPLSGDGLGGVLVAVVHVGDAHVVARPHVVADLDELVPDHAGATADEAAVADAHHDIGQVGMTGAPARRQGGTGADHGAGADVDVAFIHMAAVGEADRRTLAERAEASGPG